MSHDPLDELIADLERIVAPDADPVPQPPSFDEIQYWVVRTVDPDDEDDARGVQDNPAFQDYLARLHRSQRTGG